MRINQMPGVDVRPDSAPLGGGLDLISPPGYARAGTARFATNYEPAFGGGYRRVGGFERYSGQFRPHLAEYVLMEAGAGFTGVVVGNTVTGGTSGATGKVIYLSGNQLAVTKIVGGPFVEEVLSVGGSPVGTVTNFELTIDGFLDNEIQSLAANDYRADIGKPGAGAGGTGPILGVAVLNSVVYCWREVAGALVTYKATSSGWVAVPLYSQVSFSGGSSEYIDGSTLTQGANSATIKRVVLESGDWLAGTAAGRFIVEPVSGSFAAGICGGGGVANLAGAATAITQFAGGRVSSTVYNFTASLSTRRLYCCDGINLEWEFDGTTIVPLNTGMAGIRATQVACHKNYLFYGYRSSLQHSALGLPYQWSAVLGAGELGTGDTITNLVSVSGTEASAALMAICQDSAWVLYGSAPSGADGWRFVRVSEEAGAQAYSAQEIGQAMAFDRDGFKGFSPTDTFGNFSYDSSSLAIDPLVRNARVKTSVLVKNKSIYRCFFADGLFVTGMPSGKGMAWMPCDYGRVIEVAIGAEVAGDYRVFLGDFDGWVLEADVGRSFDGAVVTASMRLSSQNQKSPQIVKQYRHAEIDSSAESAFELQCAAEFSDAEADLAGTGVPTQQNSDLQYGAGLFYDFESWDRAYWDISLSSRMRFPVHGQGRSLSLLVFSESATEMPHTLKSSTITYTPRRMGR